jgi:hypothetical protein
MAVIIGGKEIAAVYAAGVVAHGDGPFEVRKFREMIVKLSGEEPEIGDSVEFNLGRINEHLGTRDRSDAGGDFHPFG